MPSLEVILNLIIQTMSNLRRIRAHIHVKSLVDKNIVLYVLCFISYNLDICSSLSIAIKGKKFSFQKGHNWYDDIIYIYILFSLVTLNCIVIKSIIYMEHYKHKFKISKSEFRNQ